MMEKGKISAFQMALLIEPTITATAILSVPAISGKFAERDLWISPILGSLTGFITVFIVIQLHKLYPKETIFQFSRHIIGRLPGNLLGFSYLFFFLYINGIICRQYADFVITYFFPKTPLIVIIGSMILVCSFAVRGGLEVIARVAQILIPLFILSPILFILLIPEIKPSNLFPIMENGILPPFLGAISPSAWFSEVFLISMILPFVTNQEKGSKWGAITIIVIVFHLVLTDIVSIFLLGNLATYFNYPVFVGFRYISVVNFLEHLESLVIAIWVMGAFIKISVFYYGLALGTAQWLHLTEYRNLVYPLGFVEIILSIWSFSDAQELYKFLETVIPFYIPFFMTFLPMLLLLIAVIRKKEKDPMHINQ